MIFFNYTSPKMIVAEKGKQIRDKNDVYFKDETTGEEHLPYYTTTVFVPDDFTEEDMNELYVEEELEVE